MPDHEVRPDKQYFAKPPKHILVPDVGEKEVREQRCVAVGGTFERGFQIVHSFGRVGVDFVIDVGVFDLKVSVLVDAVEHEDQAHGHGDGKAVGGDVAQGGGQEGGHGRGGRRAGQERWEEVELVGCGGWVRVDWEDAGAVLRDEMVIFKILSSTEVAP